MHALSSILLQLLCSLQTKWRRQGRGRDTQLALPLGRPSAIPALPPHFFLPRFSALTAVTFTFSRVRPAVSVCERL